MKHRHYRAYHHMPLPLPSSDPVARIAGDQERGHRQTGRPQQPSGSKAAHHHINTSTFINIHLQTKSLFLAEFRSTTSANYTYKTSIDPATIPLPYPSPLFVHLVHLAQDAGIACLSQKAGNPGPFGIHRAKGSSSLSNALTVSGSAPTTTITIDSQPSPTTSSRSDSHSNSFTDEDYSSGTGVHVPSNVSSNDFSDSLDESWDPVYSDEIEPSESASRPTSRPRTGARYRTSESRPPATSRAPNRRHTTSERQPRRPPVARVHRHPVPAPPSSVDPEDYPGYGRGYPAPQPGPFGARGPQPGYAPSSYSVPAGGGGFAPPFGGPLQGALTQYGAPGGYQYPPQNPFSPLSPPTAPTPGGAGYFNGNHHPMSSHSSPGPVGYNGHDMIPHPQFNNFGGGYPSPYQQMPPPQHQQHLQQYVPQHPHWPASDHGSAVGAPQLDPETEKKLAVLDVMMKQQQLDREKAEKEEAEKRAREERARQEEAAAKKAAEERAAWEEAEKRAREERARQEEAAAKKAEEEKAAWQKKMEEEKKAALAAYEESQKAAAAARAAAEKKAAEEKAAWEKKLEDEKRQTLLNYEAAQKAAAEATAAAEKKAAEEKAAWERKLIEEKRQTLLNYEAAQKKAEEDRAEAARKAAEEKALWERKLEEEKKISIMQYEAAQKAATEAAAEAAQKAADEKAAWEKKLKEEREAAMAKGVENAKKAAEAERKKAEEKAAEEQAKADAAAELAKIKKELADEAARAKEEAAKLKKEAEENEAKLKKEAAEALAKALAPPPPDDKKKPIRFKDAVGRKFSFPFHLCATWQGMEELIKQAFLHVEIIGPHVQHGHYDLIGPNGEIILPQVWETMIEPDWAITMHMWPMPEKQAGPPPGQNAGPPPGHHFSQRGGERPRSSHGHAHGVGGRGPPNVPSSSAQRGGGSAHQVPPPPPPHVRPRMGSPSRDNRPGGAPVLVSKPGSPPPRKKKPEPKGMLSWMAGMPAKSSGKGPKKAEPDPCVVM
ncbi:hypothetical protein MBM_07804 [Drepanopeziza brunnea f. sp. 'multigermtubi' MB_m1]|uniref:Ubiquitin-like domain-containing protein n=1 Tax=Marssonina brunnea f. sp. multigermtubi (strain MB_m1) TaxID=1072389 RepID=K1WP78_MARBU|nr:uncharacterized protein MBM_07804 [Drepanopeziza brunnea f. sp. 'multigermtubi' MB_m1]EKD14127.1 hypothetical protein MBM_07804 [Drepanopeziza brunnea f. sp. 'multigermtubi' MB_m1]